jgi:hypothetical protein
LPQASVVWCPLQTTIGHYVADIFISYCNQQQQPTRDVAACLEAEGYSVWWDTNLIPGELFRGVIEQELNAAEAVIVIWTNDSVVSDWVISEAEHGRRNKKLIPLRTRDLTEPIPLPFDTIHTGFVDDRPAVLAAVRRFVSPVAAAREAEASAKSKSQNRRPPEAKDVSDRSSEARKAQQPRRGLVVGGFVFAAIVLGSVATIWWESPWQRAESTAAREQPLPTLPAPSAAVPEQPFWASMPLPTGNQVEPKSNSATQPPAGAPQIRTLVPISASTQVRPQSNTVARPSSVDDRDMCDRDPAEGAEDGMAACTRAINSGRWQGDDLAALYFRRGSNYEFKDDLDRAIDDYNEAIQLNSDDPPTYQARGRAKKAKGDTAGGAADIARARQLDPNLDK